MIRIGSLCSGYGGLDLAVMSVFGGEVAWHAEVHPAACRVLNSHWPGVPNHGDLTKANWRDVEWVDILTAGYPCQPFSSAGKRKETDVWDERSETPWDVAANAVHHRRQGCPELDEHAQVAGLGAQRHPDGCDVAFEWGAYDPAVRRWERILGRPAPVPYDLNRNGKPRLRPQLQEWMLGLPDGWITAVPGVSRNDAGHLAGNGVCPQQAELALRTLLEMARLEVAA